MIDILLTITQALQLVALAPCVFVIAFLLCSARKNGDNVVPILYFLTLAAGFVIPLLPIFGELAEQALPRAVLQWLAMLNVALSFLLVVQFVQGRIPSLSFWLILLLPVIGGTPFVYASVFTSEVCLDSRYCYRTEDLRILYNIFSGALVFLLLTLYVARSSSSIAVEDVDRAHKRWLIISLVTLNLAILLIDLLQLSAAVKPEKALFTATIIRIAFIYIVLTSIFRVFYDLFDIQLTITPLTKASARNTAQDEQVTEHIKQLLEQRHIYREMGFSRESLAKQLGISEHQTSRIINTYFGKNFNELINHYRIREAKERLLTEDTQVTIIAFEVGFNSIASFNRVFKEITNASPTEFRAFHKNSAA